MAGRPFTEVLDDALVGHRPLPPRATTWRVAAPPPGPLHFGTPTPPPSLGHAAYVLAAAMALPHAAAPRAPRPLTPAQRDAVNALARLGATLSPAFDATELRSSYRSLARRLHPDRHQSSTATVRARLASDFAAATDHYKTLLALFPRH